MNPVTDEMRADVRRLVLDFFALECDIDASDIHAETRIIEELDGDSLMFLSLLELVKKKYALEVQLKTLGKFLMKRPAETVGQVIDLTILILERGDEIGDML